MGKAGGGTKLPGFCLNRIRPHARVRSPPSVQSKPSAAENGNLNVSDRKEADATQRNPFLPSRDPGRQRAKAASGERDQESAPRNHQLLQSMKSVCQSKRPEVRVETASVEGNEKGPTTVEEARRRGTEGLPAPRLTSPKPSLRNLNQVSLSFGTGGS
ncbi:hypothetical protein MLD38_007465 [Melastoma candidum]|uniref:Uncharacterized protein n=1 Tax=Melastoma candidum TaxID=119954 RepID=A0ACB9RVH7_9MYRT|nr:hypothetical protein MLD38_007465 [Melastoma candidum]